MNKKNNILWITSTAIFIALLIVLQAATAPMGNIIITGSIVNLLLIVSVMTCGLGSGLTVAAVSPVMAKFLILYIGIVQIDIPIFLGLSEPQAAVISNMFSIPQLITALIGGALAVFLLPRLKKAITRGQE